MTSVPFKMWKVPHDVLSQFHYLECSRELITALNTKCTDTNLGFIRVDTLPNDVIGYCVDITFGDGLVDCANANPVWSGVRSEFLWFPLGHGVRLSSCVICFNVRLLIVLQFVLWTHFFFCEFFDGHDYASTVLLMYRYLKNRWNWLR